VVRQENRKKKSHAPLTGEKRGVGRKKQTTQKKKKKKEKKGFALATNAEGGKRNPASLHSVSRGEKLDCMVRGIVGKRVAKEGKEKVAIWGKKGGADRREKKRMSLIAADEKKEVRKNWLHGRIHPGGKQERGRGGGAPFPLRWERKVGWKKRAMVWCVGASRQTQARRGARTGMERLKRT